MTDDKTTSNIPVIGSGTVPANNISSTGPFNSYAGNISSYSFTTTNTNTVSANWDTSATYTMPPPLILNDTPKDWIKITFQVDDIDWADLAIWFHECDLEFLHIGFTSKHEFTNLSYIIAVPDNETLQLFNLRWTD